MGRGILLLLLAVSQPQDEATPTVRVLLKEVSALTVECKGAIDLKKPGVAKPIMQFGKITPTKIELVDGKFKILDRAFDEPWISFEVKSEPLKIGDRHYPAQIHLVRESGKFKVVNEIDIETYLIGVIGAEIGAGSPIEALKAQAIAARSYVAAGIEGWPRLDSRRPVWDVYDDTRSQVYVGVPPKNLNVERAVRETSAQMIFYKGKIVRAYFSACCGGHTLGVREWSGGTEIPPLAGVPCGYCAGAHAWSKKFTLSELDAKLHRRTGGKPINKVTVKDLTASQRPSSLTLECAGGNVQVTAKDFRDTLGLSTTMFTVKQDGETVTCEGAGYGHGVGLCQLGTIGMAQKGAKAPDIISHYYPQSQLLPGYSSHKSAQSPGK